MCHRVTVAIALINKEPVVEIHLISLHEICDLENTIQTDGVGLRIWPRSYMTIGGASIKCICSTLYRVVPRRPKMTLDLSLALNVASDYPSNI